MHYEVYVDRIIFINFTMNLYILLWVNRHTFHTATSGRLILGAVAGAIGFLVTISGVGPPGTRMIVGVAIGTVGMLKITFKVKGMKMLLKLLRQLMACSFLMGGALLFLLKLLPECRQYLVGVIPLAGAGGIIFLLLGKARMGVREKGNLCKATLIRNEVQITVTALLDSGNSLVEPISGKPVCVVDKEVQRQLWGTDTTGFRVIPYHSIGKQRGIMEGYPLEKLSVDVDGMMLELKGVYVAVSKEAISGMEDANGTEIKMIINPEILKRERSRVVRRNVRSNDFESSNTGKNAV